MVRPVTAGLGVLVLATALCFFDASAATSDAHTRHYDARGLDSCNAPTHAQMAAFWHQTPWWWWGIYIGGVNRACPNQNLTPRWIRRETRRGWGLQPIWVGRQAPCAGQGGLAEMSIRPARAHRQGRRAAVHAYRSVQRLRMSTRTPVAYDMEAFDTSKRNCLRAVEAFVRGWSHQLRVETRVVPGYYGSTCSSAVAAMWRLSTRPVYIWGAAWGSGRQVSRMSCVGPDVWPHRLKQYAGGSRVRENGVTMMVDKDCADGPMYASRRRDRGDCT